MSDSPVASISSAIARRNPARSFGARAEYRPNAESAAVQAARMGKNGLRAVREKYNWEMEQKKLLSLYETLLGTTPATA